MTNGLPFQKDVFIKALLAAFALYVLGHLAAFIIYKETTLTDIVGSTIFMIVGAYFLHLLAIFGKKE